MNEANWICMFSTLSFFQNRRSYLIIIIVIVLAIIVTSSIIEHRKDKANGVKNIGKGYLIGGIIASATIMIVIIICGFVYSIFNPEKFYHREETYEVYGDFIYQVVYLNDEGNEIKKYTINRNCVDSYIRIIGLSELGKSKEIVIVPQYISDVRVDKVMSSERFESEVLKKMYIPFEISYCYNFADHFRNPLFEGVLILSDHVPSDGTFWGDSKYHYFPSYANLGSRVLYANVSYLYNYEDTPNHGYYWIDNYDYGEKIKYKPVDPVRDGYVFAGWYKEAECINEWDFDVDKLPDPIYISDSSTTPEYQETILYAKWVEED